MNTDDEFNDQIELDKKVEDAFEEYIPEPEINYQDIRGN